jgi:RNA polymerase sigma-70 factor (ECF subfamily)
MEGLDHLERTFVALSRRNDPRALDLVWPFRPRLVLSLRRKFGSYIPYEDCEDLATAALLEAYERGKHYNPAKARLTTWLNLLAHYHALQFLRKHNCEYLPDDELLEVPAAVIVQAEEAVRELPSKEMQLALSQLPPVWARAIRLFYYEGLSIPLIAEEMHIVESTVRCYLARGIARLGEVLSIPKADSEE